MIPTRRGVLTLLGAASFCACATPPKSGEERGVLSVDGGDVAYRRRFGRGPTIVFESGLGDGLESWDTMFAEIAGEHSLFAYSRPGYGGSAARPISNDRGTSEAAARFLHAVLDAAGIDGQIVLVGHSLGGMYIARFAALYPDRVAALVFDDGRPPGFRARCGRENLPCAASPPPAPSDWPAHIVAEREGIAEAETNPPAVASIARIPTTIIVGSIGQPTPEGLRVRAAWTAEQRAFATGFRDARVVIAEGAGHYVHCDQPQLVAREIERRASP